MRINWMSKVLYIYKKMEEMFNVVLAEREQIIYLFFVKCCVDPRTS